MISFCLKLTKLQNLAWNTFKNSLKARSSRFYFTLKKSEKLESGLSHLFSRSRTELAVLASSPVVGSSRNRTAGSMISSMPMFVLFLSPPEIPRVICVPTWGTKKTPTKHNGNRWKRASSAGAGCLLEDRWVTGCDYLQHLGVSHFGETQFFNEVIDSSLLLDLRHGDVQSQSGRKTQILPHGQGAHDHIFLAGTPKLDQRSQTEKLFCSYHFHKSLRETTRNKTEFTASLQEGVNLGRVCRFFWEV